ncbi:hypothetical protein CR157_18415 [Halomonas sp. LBP4]|nr:hypothetical protein CR157_18415 [Halomonas sp. LBP4]
MGPAPGEQFLRRWRLPPRGLALTNPHVFLDVDSLFAKEGAEAAPMGSDPSQVAKPVIVRLASGFDAAGV